MQRAVQGAGTPQQPASGPQESIDEEQGFDVKAGLPLAKADSATLAALGQPEVELVPQAAS